MKSVFRFFVIPLVVLLVAFSVYSWVGSNFLSDSNQQQSSGEALVGGPFELTNQYGAVVNDEDFRGSLMLVYFGFTNCPMICPTDMSNITAAMEGLGDDSEEVTPIFITIDPERDNVEQIKSFASNFYPTFQALTGAPEQIADVANAYRIYYKQVQSDELQEYTMDHSAYIYLMGRDGKYLTHFRHDQPVDQIVSGIRGYL